MNAWKSDLKTWRCERQPIPTAMKFILKWVFRLLLLVAALIVLFLLALDPILRLTLQHRIRTQTGLDAEIGQFTLGLTRPTLTLRDFKVFNPPGFGGTPFLDIREIHVEYDRAALARGKLHLRLLRFNLAELDIVRNQAGETNLFSFRSLPPEKTGGAKNPSFTARTGMKFEGIDELNVSIGRLRFIDLQDPSQQREQVIGLENCVMKNVKTVADLGGMALLVGLRSGNFFDSLISPKALGGSRPDFLNPLF